jgi:hypothetical protein
MNLLKPIPVKKEMVQNSLQGVQKQLLSVEPSRHKVALLSAALILSALLVGGLYAVSGGDMNVLRQRLIGQVTLSTGTFSARSMRDLNQLSWDNGLQILATLEAVDTTIALIQSSQSEPKYSAKKLAQHMAQLKTYEKEIQQLLKDRQALNKAAAALKTNESLYAPVYSEHLHDTMDKITAIKNVSFPTDSLVQR